MERKLENMRINRKKNIRKKRQAVGESEKDETIGRKRRIKEKKENKIRKRDGERKGQKRKRKNIYMKRGGENKWQKSEKMEVKLK